MAWRRPLVTSTLRGLAASATGTVGQNALFVACLQGIGVEALAQEHLAGVAALGALGHQPLLAFATVDGPLGPHGQDVFLDRHVNGVGIHSRQVEMGHQLVTMELGVHGKNRGATSATQMLGQPLHLTERIESHEHVLSPPFLALKLASPSLVDNLRLRFIPLRRVR